MKYRKKYKSIEIVFLNISVVSNVFYISHIKYIIYLLIKSFPYFLLNLWILCDSRTTITVMSTTSHRQPIMTYYSVGKWTKTWLTIIKQWWHLWKRDCRYLGKERHTNSRTTEYRRTAKSKRTWRYKERCTEKRRHKLSGLQKQQRRDSAQLDMIAWQSVCILVNSVCVTENS